jgi:hypothetical protein
MYINFPNFADTPARAARAAISTATDKNIAQDIGFDNP